MSSIKHPDGFITRDPNVLAGWVHKDMGQVIELTIQGASSQLALKEERLESHKVLLTHGQAALLGKYLIDISGKEMPRRRAGLRALLGRSFGG